MRERESDYLPIIRGNLLIPITKLLESLKLSGVKSVNEVQTSPFENGYSVAIVLLSVVLLESAVNRYRCFHDIAVARKDSVHEYFGKTFLEAELSQKILELFVVRDVIAHNHIWETRTKYDENNELRLVSASLIRGGDRKFNASVDIDKRKTRLLGINVFPTRICWADVIIVLKTVVDCLLFLEQKDPGQKYISDDTEFTDLVSSLG